MQVLRVSQSHRNLIPRFHTTRIATLCFAAGGLALIASGAGTSSAATGPTAKNVVISTLVTAKFGTILVSDTTLYTLVPSDVACNATCHKYWPEVLLPKGATKASIGKGVNASKFATVRRPGGVLQVTYAGKPLYWFALDNARGQVKGNVTDTWGKWSDVVTVKPAVSTTTTTTTVPPTTTTTTRLTTTTQPTTTTTTQPTTTTTAPGGGGVGF
jgi:predicted lipoprotein with Yx(FWY)xxD motif